MVFQAGWSPGDLVKLVELGIDAYRFWKDAGPDAQALQEKLKYLVSQLNFPEDLLEQVGRKAYPYADALERDLQSHNQFFLRFKGLTKDGDGASRRRLKETIQWAWKSHSVTRIKENIADHLDKLRDFRQEMILTLMAKKFRRYKTSRKSKKAIGNLPIRDAEGPSRASLLLNMANEDHDLESILSKAAIAYEIGEDFNARYSTSAQTRTPTLGPRSSTRSFSSRDALKFKETIVELAVSSRLYLGEISPTEDAEDIRKIAKALDDLYQFATSSPSSISTASPSIAAASSFWDQESPGDKHPSMATTPPSSLMPPNSIPFRSGREDTAIASTHQDFHEDRQDLPGNVGSWPARQLQEDEPNMPPFLSPLHDDSSRSSSDGLSFDDLDNEEQFRGSDSDPMAQSAETVMAVSHQEKHVVYMSGPLAGKRPVSRCLALSQSDGATWLSITAEALTPEQLFAQRRPHVTPATGESVAATYEHKLGPGLWSYPYIKHPVVDTVTPMHKDFRYSIHFVKPQYYKSSHPTQELESPSIKYHLRSSAGRTALREAIFGKTLLANVGADEVWVELKVGRKTVRRRACRKESLSLWKEKLPDPQAQVPVLSIAFLDYAEGNLSAPEDVLEYGLRSHKDLIEDLRTAKKRHQNLRLDVEPIISTDAHEPFARTASVSTTGTTSTTGSMLSRLSRRSSSAATSPKTTSTYVEIKFSEAQEVFIEDKKKFLNKMIEHFGAVT